MGPADRAAVVSDEINRMLEAAPCPVSETLIWHYLEVDDDLEYAVGRDEVHAALSDLRDRRAVVHVDHAHLAKRWPPEVFESATDGGHDVPRQLALGAWATVDKAHEFDRAVKAAHLPKASKLRPYLDTGWWGRIQPDPAQVRVISQQMNARTPYY